MKLTKDKIVKLAKQAGLFIAHDSEGHFSAVHDGEIFDMYPDGDKERDRLYREQRFVEILEPFAELVVEACAQECESDDSLAGDWHWEAHVGGYFARLLRSKDEE